MDDRNSPDEPDGSGAPPNDGRPDETSAQLAADVYGELKRLASAQLRRAPERPLHTTALVHEAWLKLGEAREIDDRGRNYFFGAAARAMRQVLVDQARKVGALKRGGDLMRVTFEEGLGRVEAYAEEVLELDDALRRLEMLAPRQARVVECRHFAGLSVEETAEALAVSPRTVKSDWALARAWLYRELGPS